MKHIITTVAALAISAAFVTAADAPKKPKADPAAAWAKMSGGQDTITKEQFVGKPKDDAAKAKKEAAFAAKDTNKDGKLTKDEFMAAPAKKAKK
jgi:hypothetical protein